PVESWHPQAARQVLRLMLHLRRAGASGSIAPTGQLAVLNLGHAISELQEIAGGVDADPDARDEAFRALQLLRDFAGRPMEVADALLAEAGRATSAAVSLAMRDAAMALRDASNLLLF